MAGCLISARLWLLGFDAADQPLWRRDATIRVDGGMVAQIGAFAAVAYGVDHLARFGDPSAFALPIFAPTAKGSLAARFGGSRGRLTPGSPAHVALFAADVAPVSRAALLAERAGVEVFLDGLPVAAWRHALDAHETPEEAALWAAAAREPRGA